MRTQLHVSLDADGIPRAEVPSASMWDLVEYLSCHRISVTYQYQATHFVVLFSRNDLETAQRMLDEWAASAAHVLQTV